MKPAPVDKPEGKVRQETRGRPKRKEPYIIPEIPANREKIPKQELDKLRYERALAQSKAASLRWRRNKEGKERLLHTAKTDLERRNRDLRTRETDKMRKIKTIKAFYKNVIKDKCELCKRVLQSMISQSAPMVSIKVEMAELDLIKQEPT